jgi:hypothetical protein
MLNGLDFGTLLAIAGMLAVAGAATGVLAGIFGVGGGAISVPILFFAFGLIGVEEAVAMPLAVGTTWQAFTTSYLLRRNADFPPEIRHTHKPVQMTYRIEALGQKVSTRAGNFSDCVKVQGSAVMKLFADPVIGFKDLPLTTTEWYCKGVGLVKVQRAEPANSTFLTGGTLTLELIEWQ